MSLPSPGRRGVLIAAGVAALAPLLWWRITARDADEHRAAKERVDNSAVSEPGSPVSVMQVIAHADDDMYFMNPDVLATLGPDARSVTVVLTAGESDGRNYGGKDRRRQSAKPDRPGFAAARQNGARGAYAQMALGDRTAQWKREPLTTRGAVAQIDTLVKAPGVQLIFLGMHEAGVITSFHKNSLRGLWEEAVPRVGTLPAKGGVVPTAYSYDRESLLGTLTDLLARFRPTLLRTLDPDPESSPRGPGGARTPDDHQDHTAAGLFALEALRRYDGERGEHGESRDGPSIVVQSYRAYCNAKWPHNLGTVGFARKKRILGTYGWVDNWNCGDPSGCGDRKVGARVDVYNWAESTYPRWPGTTDWVQAGVDGTLYAFGVLDGRAVVWSSTDGNGAWSPGRSLGGGLLAPRLEVVRLSDGRLRLFGLRLGLAARPHEQRREIVTCTQDAGGSFGPWRSLGSPDGHDPVAARETGVPTAVADGTGRLHLFARNRARGLSERVLELDGSWLPWRALGGVDIQDGVSAIRLADGRVEVYAATRSAIACWSQKRLGEPTAQAAPLGAPAPGGPLTAHAGPDGRVSVFVRGAGTARILLHRQTAPGAAWTTRPPVDLGGHGGTGPPGVAAVPGVDGLFVTHRNDDHGVSIARLPIEPVGAPTWTALAGTCVHEPAITADARGRIVVASMGPDGTMSSIRRHPDRISASSDDRDARDDRVRARSDR